MLLPKLSHVIISSLLALWCAALVLWLVFGHYGRKETVSGWLDPQEGVLRVYAEEEGTIKQVMVKKGDLVVAGQVLVEIKRDRMLADGHPLEGRLLEELHRQQILIDEQLQRTQEGYVQRAEDLTIRIQAAEHNISVLQEQLSSVNEQLNLAQAQVLRVSELRGKGHASSLMVEEYIGRELELKNNYQELLREQIDRRNAIQQMKIEQELLPANKANELAQLESRRSELSLQMAQLEGQQGFVIKATKPGIVHNLQVVEGQRIRDRGIPILSLIPEDGELIAYLPVPVRAAGFVKIQQPLTIRYDAYPYQKFGLYAGEITGMSETVLLPNELLNSPVSIAEPVYLVTAKLRTSHIEAYGRSLALKPGMTFSADILVSERSLLQWVFDPIYSLRGRM